MTKVSDLVRNGLKGQKLLAQGIALGMLAVRMSPCKGKSFPHAF